MLRCTQETRFANLELQCQLTLLDKDITAQSLCAVALLQCQGWVLANY